MLYETAEQILMWMQLSEGILMCLLFAQLYRKKQDSDLTGDTTGTSSCITNFNILLIRNTSNIVKKYNKNAQIQQVPD